MRDAVSGAICFGLLVVAGCMAQAAERSWPASIPPLQPSMARIWVLGMPSEAGFISGVDAMVYTNGAALAQSSMFTVYYHDFAPGTYRFTVQPYGRRNIQSPFRVLRDTLPITPSDLVYTLVLASGAEIYVTVQAVVNCRMGSTTCSASFTLKTMSPQEAKQYLPTMKYLGER